MPNCLFQRMPKCLGAELSCGPSGCHQIFDYSATFRCAHKNKLRYTKSSSECCAFNEVQIKTKLLILRTEQSLESGKTRVMVTVVGVLKGGYQSRLKFGKYHASRLDIWIFHISRLSAWLDYCLLTGTSWCQLYMYMLKTIL